MRRDEKKKMGSERRWRLLAPSSLIWEKLVSMEMIEKKRKQKDIRLFPFFFSLFFSVCPSLLLCLQSSAACWSSHLHRLRVKTLLDAYSTPHHRVEWAGTEAPILSKFNMSIRGPEGSTCGLTWSIPEEPRLSIAFFPLCIPFTLDGMKRTWTPLRTIFYLGYGIIQ